RASAVWHVHGLTAHREESASALFVDLAGELVREVDVGLIAFHHPLADVGSGGQLHAAHLDAAVGGAHPEFDLQLEVLRLATAPDDEGVLLHRIGGRALADDRAAFGTPERGIAIPVLQRRAVEY